MPTLTASSGTPVGGAPAWSAPSHPGIHIVDNFTAVLHSGLDEVFKRAMVRPFEGLQFFRKKNMTKAAYKFQSHYGLGVVSQNGDVEQPKYDEKGLGYQWWLTANTFRGFIAIARDLQEDELYGSISDLQSDLSESYRLTMELVMADAFNRGLGTAGAPFLCEDGMYFIDSARPNAYGASGTWSNLEATGAVTTAGLYTAQLNFAYNKDERGQLCPLKMTRIIIRPNEEKGLWEILKSDLRPTDAMHAKNYMMGRFEYTVYDYLTAAMVYYLAGDPGAVSNELYFGERMAPSIKTWEDGVNPDIIRQRVRGRFGIGCGRPYAWRGAALA